MPVQTYVRKPNEIQALRWTGANIDEVRAFVPGSLLGKLPHGNMVLLRTPSGSNIAMPGDYIAKQAADDFCVIGSDTFPTLYDLKTFNEATGMYAWIENKVENGIELQVAVWPSQEQYRRDLNRSTNQLKPLLGNLPDSVKDHLRQVIDAPQPETGHLEHIAAAFSQGDPGDETPEQQLVSEEMAQDGSAPESWSIRAGRFDKPVTVKANDTYRVHLDAAGNGTMTKADPALEYKLATELLIKHHGRENLNYEDALVAMKAGYRVARAGWNGKGMWVCLGEGRDLTPAGFWNKHTKHFAEGLWAKGLSTPVLPYFIMKTADDCVLMGWLASQTDMVASDWCILEG